MLAVFGDLSEREPHGVQEVERQLLSAGWSRAVKAKKEMTTVSPGRRSWKDSPRAKTIAATISLLLIAGLIAMFAAIV
jgi:hypothetical protein